MLTKNGQWNVSQIRVYVEKGPQKTTEKRRAFQTKTKTDGYWANLLTVTINMGQSSSLKQEGPHGNGATLSTGARCVTWCMSLPSSVQHYGV